MTNRNPGELESPLLEVRYSRTWGRTLFLVGIVLLVLYGILFFRTGLLKPFHLAGVVMLVVSGLLYMRNPYFDVYPDHILVHALIGPVKKKYPFNQLSDFIVEGEKIYILSNGKKKRVWIGKMMADKEKWSQFLLLIRASDPSGEVHE